MPPACSEYGERERKRDRRGKTRCERGEESAVRGCGNFFGARFNKRSLRRRADPMDSRGCRGDALARTHARPLHAMRLRGRSQPSAPRQPHHEREDHATLLSGATLRRETPRRRPTLVVFRTTLPRLRGVVTPRPRSTASSPFPASPPAVVTMFPIVTTMRTAL